MGWQLTEGKTAAQWSGFAGGLVGHHAAGCGGKQEEITARNGDWVFPLLSNFSDLLYLMTNLCITNIHMNEAWYELIVTEDRMRLIPVKH
ncbi:MAG: hypothetical protein KGS09_00595 [Nitrospirae bacterium]|nr:hypothetical protein [Nitrospirota bacterium]MDE3043171.1 hypothetical protein [Nitrospirota bacterium]